jgi:arylsulfatase A-like enzyme
MKMERRKVLKALGAVALPSALGKGAVVPDTAATHSSPGRKPNILIFLTDDQGQWLQQAYGNSEVQTPNMTRVARNGVRMTNAFTTCPVCSPARASFFTGRMPSQHGIHDWIEEKNQAYAYPWLKDQTLISELLQSAGYHTGLVGKWHCGEERYPHAGFDFWFSYWVSQYPHTGHQNFSDNGRHVTDDGIQSPFLTDQAIHFLRTHYGNKDNKNTPFFLFVGYTDTHSPHAEMAADLVSRYSTATLRDIPGEPFPACHGDALIPVSNDPAVERRKRVEYYAAASSIDREVGRVLDELESTGQLENTLIVYTGDHGLNAGHHGMWEKGNATMPQNFLEESIRVPCAISWPGGGIPSNLESGLPVNHCDLFMTLLDVANAAPDAEVAEKINSPGHSYLSQLRGTASSSWKQDVICEYGNARMIRSDGYKLILRYPYRGVNFANELYDLKADPRETTNLYVGFHTQHPEIIEQMTSRLNEFFSKYTVPGHSGLDLEHQPMATPASPWLKAAERKKHEQSSSPVSSLR